jgi:hypothetical protein
MELVFMIIPNFKIYQREYILNQNDKEDIKPMKTIYIVVKYQPE